MSPVYTHWQLCLAGLHWKHKSSSAVHPAECWISANCRQKWLKKTFSVFSLYYYTCDTQEEDPLPPASHSSFSFKEFVTYSSLITAVQSLSQSSIALHNMQHSVVGTRCRIPLQMRGSCRRHLVGFNNAWQIAENSASKEALSKARVVEILS